MGRLTVTMVVYVCGADMASAGAASAGPNGSAELPPLHVLLRGKTGAHLVKISTQAGAASGEEGGPCGVSLVAEEGVLGSPSPADIVEFSADGTLLALFSAADKSLRVVSTVTQATLFTIEGHGNIQALHFSPLNTFLLTWERLPTVPKGSPAAGQPPEPNLLVWRVSDGERVTGWVQKTFRKADWPSVQWTRDEALAFKSTVNEIQVLTGHSPAEPPSTRIPTPNLGSFRLNPNAGASPTSPIRLACFYPESKGKPASVAVLQYPTVRTPLAAKSFYKAQEAHLRWSPNGAAVLVHTHTDVDTSGVSYYGSTGLYLLNAEAGIDATVPLPKDGAIADAQWAPAGPAQFIVIAGRMPAAATLYNAKADPVFTFGEAHRNTISWSPHGRFVCLAGFGNLAGDMDFWDRNKMKRMGSNSSHCAVGHGWSPCGRFFMTATLAPRMNVDNGIKLFRYHGAGPVASMGFEGPALFAAEFRPAPPGLFPDRPQSPLRKGATEGEGVSALPPPPAPKPKAVYRPPNSTGALAAMMRAEREGSTGPRKVSSLSGGGGGGGPPQPYIPGLAQLQQAQQQTSKNAAKNKRAKDKKKAAKEKEEEEGATSRPDTPTADAPAPPPAAQGGAAGGEEAAQDPEKRAKGLNKKLKQIEELKKRAKDGEALNDDQKAKIASEESLRKELAGLKL